MIMNKAKLQIPIVVTVYFNMGLKKMNAAIYNASEIWKLQQVHESLKNWLKGEEFEGVLIFISREPCKIRKTRKTTRWRFPKYWYLFNYYYG